MHLLICLFTSAYAPMEYSPPPPLLPWLLQLMNGRSPQCLMTLLLPVVSAVLISQLIRCTKLRGMLLYTLSGNADRSSTTLKMSVTGCDVCRVPLCSNEHCWDRWHSEGGLQKRK